MQTVKECQGVKINSSYLKQPRYASKAVGFVPQMAPTNLVARAQRGTCSVHVTMMCMTLHLEVHRAVTTALYVYGYIMNILCTYNYNIYI